MNSQFVKESTWDKRNEGMTLLRTNSDLISDIYSVRVVGSEEMSTLISFFNTSAIFRFQMKLPGQALCDKESKCGFLIEVTGGSPLKPDDFGLKLVLEKEKYPADLHCHGMSVDRLHLVVEYNFENLWYNKHIYWGMRPMYQNNGDLKVERGNFRIQYPTRLVAYYSVGRDYVE